MSGGVLGKGGGVLLALGTGSCLKEEIMKINKLTSAASSARRDATANEGHVNYDASDVIVEAIGSCMTGSGCATVGYWACNDAKNRSSFFSGEQAQYTPHQRTRRHRACREGSWEGGGSLVGSLLILSRMLALRWLINPP